jgi:hypothetical protein
VPNFGALLTQATVAAGSVDPSAPAAIDIQGSGDTGGQGSLESTDGSGNVYAGGTLSAPSLFGSEALGTAVAHLTSRGFWWGALLFALALAGIAFGIVLYFHSDISGAVTKAAAAA